MTYGRTPTPAVERFWSKVDRGSADDCWLWTAGLYPNGYGRLRVGSMIDGTRTEVLAHRFAYETLTGPIPEGMELDHLCRVRHCVNPAHLEPVAHLENVRRGDAGKHNSIKTHCPRGHPYDEANTHWREDGRYCRACSREWSRAYYRKKVSA